MKFLSVWADYRLLACVISAVWLGAAQGHWPVQLRFTFLRSAQVFELRLAAEPQAAN